MYCSSGLDTLRNELRELRRVDLAHVPTVPRPRNVLEGKEDAQRVHFGYDPVGIAQ